MHPEKKPNRLIKEKSPYLLQHAYNPVDWYAWNQEALDKAKAEDKPIFLSIGYSTCHWCHVMEQECFEDPEVAKLLNDAFVCIKVDREERPDLDAQFMAACQAMGRNCGWPLNVLLTPKLNPFLTVSYIPKHSRPGLLGMLDLVPQVMQVWKSQRQQAEIVGADVRARIQDMETRANRGQLGREVLQDATDRLRLSFDVLNGGFGSAPKFPTPHKILFLLQRYNRTGEKKALEMAEKTLTQMRLGGVYDQVGFGFHRYSTDARWLVPHFEKMLYDQALMALSYTEAYQATGANRYALAAKEVLDFVLRDLAAPEGGFYSGLDADSEGEEGKFYVWTLDEVLDTLSPADAELAVHIFGLKAEGNFEDSHGENILHIAEPLEELAPYKGLTLQELIDRLHGIRAALFEARKKRVAPAVDKKVLADWNGLMVAALAKSGSVLGELKYVAAAEKTVAFVKTRMQKGDVLFHRYFEGDAAVEGFLDDYACLAYGLTELYEATFKQEHLKAAAELAQVMVSRFWDSKNGGFFQTQKSAANLPKIKQVYDAAAPSGNSVALHVLLRLNRLAGAEPKFEELAAQTLQAFADEVEGAPDAYTFLLSALDLQLGPSYTVVVVGDLSEKSTAKMLSALKMRYLPTTLVSVKNPDKAGLGYEQIEGKATAYVCRDQTCLPPTNNVEVMLKNLDFKEQRVPESALPK